MFRNNLVRLHECAPGERFRIDTLTGEVVGPGREGGVVVAIKEKGRIRKYEYSGYVRVHRLTPPVHVPMDSGYGDWDD